MRVQKTRTSLGERSGRRLPAPRRPSDPAAAPGSPPRKSLAVSRARAERAAFLAPANDPVPDHPIARLCEVDEVLSPRAPAAAVLPYGRGPFWRAWAEAYLGCQHAEPDIDPVAEVPTRTARARAEAVEQVILVAAGRWRGTIGDRLHQ